MWSSEQPSTSFVHVVCKHPLYYICLCINVDIWLIPLPLLVNVGYEWLLISLFRERKYMLKLNWDMPGYSQCPRMGQAVQQFLWGQNFYTHDEWSSRTTNDSTRSCHFSNLERSFFPSVIENELWISVVSTKREEMAIEVS